MISTLMLKDLCKIALPMVIGQLAFASMSFIDTVLMGQLGVEILAGGGLGAVVYQFFYIVGMGMLVATANLIAFAKGENDPLAVQRALLSGVVVVLGLFLIFGGLIWKISPILLLLGQSPEMVVYAEKYLQVVVWSLLPAFGFILLRSLVLGLGNPSVILPVSIIAACLNYPVSYVLMTGMWGLPALGVQGVALGTCLISLLMFLGLAGLVYRESIFKAYPFWSKWELFSWPTFMETLTLGGPIALALAMEVGMFSAAALLIGMLGVNALAAHQVALQLTMLSFMIPLGISQAISVKVGEFYGARNMQSIRRVTVCGLVLATVSALISGSLFWFAPEWLASIFLNENSNNSAFNFSLADHAEVNSITINILFIAALFQLVDGWQVNLMGVLRGFKLGASPTLAAIFSYWFIGFPCSYLFLRPFGAVGVWMGMGIGLAVSAIILAYLFKRELAKQGRVSPGL
ncbi:MAG: MATE family multidrug resistance protein [Pseudohongiellaceae bacterium]|jgi:MATE family multidrug resistance protein